MSRLTIGASGQAPPVFLDRVAWAVTAVGAPGAVVAAAIDPGAARAAAAQDWAPFVLVAGLLLVGLVAAEDGVFDAAGSVVGSSARSGVTLFAGAATLVAVVTALLNLDTSVAFLTPVLVAAARVRAEAGEKAGVASAAEVPLEAPLLFGCLLLSNAGSLLLPGSNLTNLIVVGHLHLSGSAFAGRTLAGWVLAVVLTAVVVGVAHRRQLARGALSRGTVALVRPRGVVGVVAVAAATGVVLALRQPAPAVLAVGVAAVLARLALGGHDGGRSPTARQVRDTLGGPVLVGLLGVAIGAGTLGRAWSGPAWLLHHAGAWGTAAAGAALSVLVNNLPAASLLAAHRPSHPFSLLVGLNLGPNLFVTGSLSSLLWWRAARAAGARPSIGTVTRLGALSAPLAVAGCVAVLVVTGSP